MNPRDPRDLIAKAKANASPYWKLWKERVEASFGEPRTIARQALDEVGKVNGL